MIPFLVRHVSAILVGVPLVILVGMLVLFGIGRWAARRSLRLKADASADDLGPLVGAVFGLLGLLIAFTFAGAVGRHDHRRELVLHESLALGTAWDRFDLLPPAHQPGVRDGMRRYLEARLETYRRIPDYEAVMSEWARSGEIQREVWRDAVAACRASELPQATPVVLPALNTAFDLAQERLTAALTHPPVIVWLMLFLLALGSALIAGFRQSGTGRSTWIYAVAFAATTAIVIYAVLDIEFPRVGLVRVDAADQLLRDLLARMSG
jgi:hypothetical protein